MLGIKKCEAVSCRRLMEETVMIGASLSRFSVISEIRDFHKISSRFGQCWKDFNQRFNALGACSSGRFSIRLIEANSNSWSIHFR